MSKLIRAAVSKYNCN